MLSKFLKPRPLYLITDLFLTAFSFAAAYFAKYTYFYPQERFFDFSHFRSYLFIFILWSLLIFTVFSIKNLYATDRGLTVYRELVAVFSSLAYCSITIAAVIFFAKYKFFSRQVFLMSFFNQFFFLSSFRIIKRIALRKLIAKGFHNINVLIVGADNLGEMVLNEIKKSPHLGFNPVGFLDNNQNKIIQGLKVLGRIKDFKVVAKKYFVDEIIVTMSVYEKAIPELIKEVRRLHLGLRVFPVNAEESLPSFTISYLGLIPLINFSEKNYYISGFVIKRLLDFIISLLLLIMLMPFFIVIAILIKLDSAGPVLYIRYRMGMKGKVFKFYKFRSMVKEADTAKRSLLERNEVRDGVIFKIREDPRITKIGKFLRRFSLDELPQLFNVLIGDMSLVGPRPFPVEESVRIEYKHLPRLNIRPGITGLPQVRGRSDLSFHQWIRWDLWYVNNWSFMLDLRILFWTIPVVIKGKGAY
ncbi:MAG: sugar transferase [Candidatus Omnitrophica bacterium]|nr:sugar transferase [Candidatus Omnitrophota bacterium]